MRIVAIIGSARRNGNTFRITHQVTEHLRALASDQGVALEIEMVQLGQVQIAQCLGCRLCFDRGEASCPHNDSLAAIAQSMRHADGLIVASPVYVDDVSGLIKTWIDRLAYLCHRPALTRHCAIAIATSAVSPTMHTLGTLKMALRTWGCHVSGSAGFRMGARLPDDDMPRFDTQTKQLAQQLFGAIQRRQHERPGFMQLVTFAIQQRYWRRQTEDSVDLRYWRSQGWLARDRLYYVKPRNNSLMLLLARAIASLIAPLVS